MKYVQTFENFLNLAESSNDEILFNMEQIKKQYPKAKVEYYFAKNGDGKNYVITAKENGKTVYSSYKAQNESAVDDFLNEGTANPEEVALVKDLEKALLSNFKEVGFQRGGKQEKRYDYGNGHIHILNAYDTPDWSWLDVKRAKILQNCNVSPLYIKAELTYTEVISNAPPRDARGHIGVSGANYINNIVYFDLADPKKANIARSVKDFISKSQKAPLNEDLIEQIIKLWKSSKSNYKTIDTRDQGYGSAASTHITKSYDKAYVIKDLNIAFGKTEEQTEEIIKNHFFFKRDHIDFDWKQGVMIVNGKYTEVWD
jgi:hypothetical protein